MKPEEFTTLCKSAVYYDGPIGYPIIAGGVDNGAHWILQPFGAEAKLHVIPTVGLQAVEKNGGIEWQEGGTAKIAIVPLSQCEEFNAGDVQADIDNAAAYYATGEGKAWLEKQRAMVKPAAWKAPA